MVTPAAKREAVAHLEAEFGGIDIMVNSAGISYLQNLSDTTVEQWRREIDVNLTGSFLASQFAVRLMKDRGTPCSIVHVSSIYGLTPVAHAAAYCAAKGGMVMLSKSVALHCAERKWPVRCNTVNPGFVDTPLLRLKEDMYGGSGVMLEAMAAEIPMGKVASSENIAEAITFLSSDAASLISSTTLVIDGALTVGLAARH